LRISAANADTLTFFSRAVIFLSFFCWISAADAEILRKCGFLHLQHGATMIYFQAQSIFFFSPLILFCLNFCCQCSYLDFLFKGNVSLATTPEGMAELVEEMERAMHTLRSCIEPLVLRCRILHRSFFFSVFFLSPPPKLRPCIVPLFLSCCILHRS
jgi:hypothetical protein